MRLWGQAHVFQLLFADDLKMVAAGSRKYDLIWYMLITWIMVGAPFGWPKFRGGVCLDFVGFYMDYCKFEVGLRERRTAWIVNWVEEAPRNGGLVAHRSFVELVGRLVLCWMRPFMAPLHAWKGAIAPGTVQMVSIVLLFIAGMLKRGHHRTSGRSIVLGGRELGPEQDPRKARWYCLVVRAQEAPWLFELDTALAATCGNLGGFGSLWLPGWYPIAHWLKPEPTTWPRSIFLLRNLAISFLWRLCRCSCP